MVSHSSNDLVLDVDEMRHRLRHDEELIRELLQLFLDFYPECLEDIQRAVRAEDSTAVRETAHRFKGTLRQIHANQAAAAAQTLEEFGRHGESPKQTVTQFEQLDRDVSALLSEIRLLLESAQH